MTHDDVSCWLDAYVAAWRSYDPVAIGSLFSVDATYRYHPWEDHVAGRDAIVASWLANRDEPGTWSAAYHPWAVDGDRAVATGISRYDNADGKQTYHNVFLMRFDSDGRCAEFSEVYARER